RAPGEPGRCGPSCRAWARAALLEERRAAARAVGGCGRRRLGRASARVVSRETALGGGDGVAEQHGDGGGAYAAYSGSDGAGDGGAGLVDVGEKAAAFVADAAADDDGAGLDVFGLDDAGHAG